MPYDQEDPDSLQQRDDHNATHGQAEPSGQDPERQHGADDHAGRSRQPGKPAPPPPPPPPAPPPPPPREGPPPARPPPPLGKGYCANPGIPGGDGARPTLGGTKHPPR